MSQDFKLKFDGMRNNNPAAPEDSSLGDEVGENEFYPTSGNSRNLCFAWADGKLMFLNYAYLVSGEFISETNILSLTFTTHKVTIEGSNLVELFKNLANQSMRKLECANERYAPINTQAKFIIKTIIVETTVSS